MAIPAWLSMAPAAAVPPTEARLGGAARPPAEDDDVESEDSDFAVGPDERPAEPAVLADFLCVAKLYGYETKPPEGFELEWDRRWVAVYADGTLWHADDYDTSTASVLGDRGRVELGLCRSSFVVGGDTLVLAQEGKCHLLCLDATSRTTLKEWQGTIAAGGIGYA